MITHCTRFGGTGADVTMQVSCGGQSRRIRIDILNRDMFDPHAGTPEHTSWTMALLGRLDRALGSNIMERPVFTLSGEARRLSPKPQSSPMLEDLEKGTLFLTGVPTGLPSCTVRREIHRRNPVSNW